MKFIRENGQIARPKTFLIDKRKNEVDDEDVVTSDVQAVIEVVLQTDEGRIVLLFAVV